MEKLLAYLNSRSRIEQDQFAARCGTSVAYLRKAASIGQKLGDGLCINIERESSGAVPCESLRPDIDWAYIRSTGARVFPQEPAHA